VMPASVWSRVRRSASQRITAASPLADEAWHAKAP